MENSKSDKSLNLKSENRSLRLDRQSNLRFLFSDLRFKDSSILKFSIFLFSFFIILLLAFRLWPHSPLADRIPLSTAVWSADGELLRVTLTSDDQYRLWTPLPEISSDLVEAFLLKEDRWFYWHPGVNQPALVRGAYRTYRGASRQGGSTLTMQMARMMYRINTKTLTSRLKKAGLVLW